MTEKNDTTNPLAREPDAGSSSSSSAAADAVVVEERTEKKKPSKKDRDISVRKTSNTIAKATSSKKRADKRRSATRKTASRRAIDDCKAVLGVYANNGSVAFGMSGTGGTVSVEYQSETKPFRQMTVDCSRGTANIDGRAMTVSQAIQEGYMTSDGATVGQKSGYSKRVFNF